MNGLIGDISYKGKLLSDFGVFPDFSNAFNTPEYDVGPISIPGRNGDLLVPGYRFKNRRLTIKCFIKKNFLENYKNLVDFLTEDQGSYERLEFSAESDIYQMAAFYAAIIPETGPFQRWGRFDLVFDCQPQKFLKLGEQPTTLGDASSYTFLNPTLKPARPLIRVNYVRQNGGTIDIEGETIAVAYTPYSFFIDCDQMRAYRASGNSAIAMDTYVTMPDDYVEFPAGMTQVTTTNVDVTIFPRWWRL